VARLGDEFLDKDTVIAKGVGRFVLRRLKPFARFTVVPGDPHALATAARTGFDHDRVSDFVGNLYGVFRVIKYKLSNGAVAGMAIDVTELKEREAQLDAARIEAEKMGKVKSDFLAHMSHELRTPLNAIMGFTELTRMTLDETAQSKQMTYLRHVLDSGKHLVSLIDNLLDLSRIEANAQELNEAVCSVNGILRAAASILAPMAAQKDIRLELRRCPPDLHVMADERAIRQIIVNLATNAIYVSGRACRVRGHDQCGG
jgi:signal transduction histidine kinase